LLEICSTRGSREHQDSGNAGTLGALDVGDQMIPDDCNTLTTG
jgi:hypothetical protein